MQTVNIVFAGPQAAQAHVSDIRQTSNQSDLSDLVSPTVPCFVISTSCEDAHRFRAASGSASLRIGRGHWDLNRSGVIPVSVFAGLWTAAACGVPSAGRGCKAGQGSWI